MLIEAGVTPFFSLIIVLTMTHPLTPSYPDKKHRDKEGGQSPSLSRRFGIGGI
jgi:hypothetical protein